MHPTQFDGHHTKCVVYFFWKEMEAAEDKSAGFSTNQICTKGVDAMISLIEPVLYIDEQAAVPMCFCEICGGECYRIGPVCGDCLEEMS
jgi:hypothetical protein